ncbi:hypothetical protein J6590_075307 [Homalodisca vitripennis]|nr:hypothetical protein J6590_075307 [Homalodisca vitripennis]
MCLRLSRKKCVLSYRENTKVSNVSSSATLTVRASGLLNHLRDHTVGSGCLFPQKKITRNDLQPDGKKKKRSSITSSSPSSSSSSAERSPSPKRKNQLSHERSKSRSRFSARSPTVPPPCPPESSDKRRGKDKAARTGANTSKGTRPQHPRTRPQHPPKATDAVTNELFETMRNRRPDSAPRAASLVSAMSSVSTTTHRPPRPPLDLERCLLDTLRGKGLCTKTVVAMKTLVHTVRTRELVEATRSIMYVSPDAAVQKPPPPDYPTFDPHNYLFCGKAQSFGYDYRTLYYNQHLRERSLTHALKPGCKRDPQKMSLDLVFRKALKEIAEELHEIDPEPLVISLENPMVQCNGLDLSKYLTQSSADKTSPLKQYVEGSRCEEYVRVLHDRYALNSGADLINAKAKSLIMPSSMRVWTDVETQASASLRMYNNVQTLFEKAKTINNANAKGADDIASSITRFTETYAKHMGYFMKMHRQFLAQALRASELFTWMCFGITTDEALAGTTIMATNYTMANSNSENTCICWNYPLACMITEQRTNAIAPPPLLVVDDNFTEAVMGDCVP